MKKKLEMLKEIRRVQEERKQNNLAETQSNGADFLQVMEANSSIKDIDEATLSSVGAQQTTQ